MPRGASLVNCLSLGYFWQAEGSPWIWSGIAKRFPWVIFSHVLRDGEVGNSFKKVLVEGHSSSAL